MAAAPRLCMSALIPVNGLDDPGDAQPVLRPQLLALPVVQQCDAAPPGPHQDVARVAVRLEKPVAQDHVAVRLADEGQHVAGCTLALPCWQVLHLGVELRAGRRAAGGVGPELCS
jgi:hypothetical protein